MSIQIYPTSDHLFAAALDIIIDVAAAAINEKGVFTIVLSGGETPRPLYENLANQGSANSIEWNRTHIFWSDERTVPPDHPESNFYHVNQLLLKPRNIPLENIHRIKGELDPIIAASSYQSEISDWFQDSTPFFDLILLGMGGDGHTASLFPGTDVVTNRGKYHWVAANQIPQQKSWRITFTPQLINTGQTILFLVSGQNKAHTIKQVLEGPFLPEIFPAQLIKPDQGKLIWMIDQAVASNLES